MYLNLIVLKALSEGQKSGYDLMKYLKEHVGWKVSPGSIYPLLNSLLRKQQVTQKITGRKKFYIITNKGRSFLLESGKLREKMVENAKNNIRVMGGLCGIHDTELMCDLMDRFKSTESPFGKMTYDVLTLRKQVLEIILDRKKLQKNRSRIRAIILDTTKKLSKIK